MKHFTWILLVLFSMTLSAQEIIDPESLPDVEDYIFVQSNPGADTIIIALHGGPTDELYPGSFEYMESIPTFSVVEILKHEMMTDVLFNPNLTFEEGVAVNDTTVALIEKVVQHYNDQFKTVVLLGHSWGAIIMGEYLEDYGTENIHRIIPMEGRISVQQEFVDHLLDGHFPTFDIDGTSILVDSFSFFPSGMLTLGAAAFANRWTDSLVGQDLSKMMYTYAENDQQTGALIDVELDFLDASGAQTLFIPQNGHGASFEDENQAIIVDFIRGGIISSSPTIAIEDDFKLYPTVANQWIQIESIQDIEHLSVYNISGNLVYQSKESKSQIKLDVSSFAQGQYVAVVQNGSKKGSAKRFQLVR